MENLKQGNTMLPYNNKESIRLHRNIGNNSIHTERFCKIKSIGEIIHFMEEGNLLPKKVSAQSKVQVSRMLNLSKHSKNHKRITIKL
jgi:hypothetical protein